MKKILILFSAVLLSLSAVTYISANTVSDKKAPEIEVLKDKVRVVLNDESFRISDYIEVKDDSDFSIISLGKFDINVADEYKLDLYALDVFGNVATAKIEVDVITQEEMDGFNALENYNHSLPAREYNYYLDTINSNLDERALEVANMFVGWSGSCDVIAQYFLNNYFDEPKNVFRAYVIPFSEALPGDVIYYVNGGVGLQHYAIYLGGDTALQGNWLGYARIGKVYLNSASEPIFMRCY